MDDIMGVSITRDALIDEFSVFVHHHMFHMQKSMELLCVFLHCIHEALLLHFISNREDFGTSHCLVFILSQEVDPSNYWVILIISGNQFSESRSFEVICEFFDLSFFNEPKLPIFGHSRIYNVLRSENDLFHNMCQLYQGIFLKFLHDLILL